MSIDLSSIPLHYILFYSSILFFYSPILFFYSILLFSYSILLFYSSILFFYSILLFYSSILFSFLFGGSAVVVSRLVMQSYGGRLDGIFAVFPAVYFEAVIGLNMEYKGGELYIVSEQLSNSALIGIIIWNA